MASTGVEYLRNAQLARDISLAARRWQLLACEMKLNCEMRLLSISTSIVLGTECRPDGRRDVVIASAQRQRSQICSRLSVGTAVDELPGNHLVRLIGPGSKGNTGPEYSTNDVSDECVDLAGLIRVSQLPL